MTGNPSPDVDVSTGQRCSHRHLDVSWGFETRWCNMRQAGPAEMSTRGFKNAACEFLWSPEKWILYFLEARVRYRSRVFFCMVGPHRDGTIIRLLLWLIFHHVQLSPIFVSIRHIFLHLPVPKWWSVRDSRRRTRLSIIQGGHVYYA